MTPKEKAEQLVESFLSFTSNEATTEDGFIYSERMRVWNAKQCALIAVDEMIELLADDSWRNRNELMFYEEVEKQIHAL